MQGNLSESVKAVLGIAPVSLTATTHDTAVVDCLGFENALILVNVGVITTGGTIDLQVYEGDTTSPATLVVGAAFVQIADTGGGKLYVAELNLKARKRYIKATITNGTQAALGAVSFILSGAKSRPVTQQNAVRFVV